MLLKIESFTNPTTCEMDKGSASANHSGSASHRVDNAETIAYMFPDAYLVTKGGSNDKRRELKQQKPIPKAGNKRH